MNSSEFNYSTGENYQPSPLIVTSATGVPNPMAATAATADASETSKRTALAGQWRTPPTPFFPSGGSTEELAAFEQQIKLEESSPSNPIVQVVGTSLAANIHNEVPLEVPHSTEDYAKALQEAYRRGAEAAARAAAQQMASASI